MSGRRSGGGGPGDGDSRWRAGWAGGREPRSREGAGGRWHLRGPLARWTPRDLGLCPGGLDAGAVCDDFGVCRGRGGRKNRAGTEVRRGRFLGAK